MAISSTSTGWKTMPDMSSDLSPFGLLLRLRLLEEAGAASSARSSSSPIGTGILAADFAISAQASAVQCRRDRGPGGAGEERPGAEGVGAAKARPEAAALEPPGG